MYKIKNISGYLSVAGLYPGKTRNVNEIDAELKNFADIGLLSIIEIPKKDKKPIVIDDNISKEEVE